MYARPCSIKWRVQFHFSCKTFVEFRASSFCLTFGNVKIILNIRTLLRAFDFCLAKMFNFNASILTLFVSIFNEHLFFVWLRFHYNLISLTKKRISLTILETRLSVFVQLLLNWQNWLCRVGIIKTFAVFFHRLSWELIVVNQKSVKHVLALKLLSLCYKRIGSCF